MSQLRHPTPVHATAPHRRAPATRPHRPGGCLPAPRVGMRCPLGPPIPMRMPRNTGGILITTLDIDPHGGLVSFGGTWQPHVDLTTTRPGTVVVQVLPPR